MPNDKRKTIKVSRIWTRP